jgi:hypothetical protein
VVVKIYICLLRAMRIALQALDISIVQGSKSTKSHYIEQKAIYQDSSTLAVFVFCSSMFRNLQWEQNKRQRGYVIQCWWSGNPIFGPWPHSSRPYQFAVQEGRKEGKDTRRKEGTTEGRKGKEGKGREREH